METILVCKPSGKNSFYPAINFICSIIGVVYTVYSAWNGTPRWGTFCFFLALGIFSFFLARSQFFGEEHLGIDGKDFIIHYVKYFPFKRDKRIPLSEIAEVRFNQKSKAQEVGEINLFPYSYFFSLGGPAPCGRRRALRFTSLRSCSLQSLPRQKCEAASIYANSYCKVCSRSKASTVSQTSA